LIGESLALLDQAIARDPGYGLALAAAAGFRAIRTSLAGSDDVAQERHLALVHRTAALRAAPDDPEVLAYAALAAIFAGMDRNVALASAERAVALNPGAAFAWLASGVVHVYAGDAEKGLAELETCTRLDPRSPWRGMVLDNMVIALFALRRFDEVIVTVRQVCDLLPALAEPYQPYIAAALAHAGRLSEAREAAGQVTENSLAAWSVWLSLIDPAHRELALAGFKLARGQEGRTLA
jgi:adenylate cyclase